MGHPRRYIRILTIAGSDSGGAAGIQADLKTMSALGCYGMSAITAITVQNTLGVTGIHSIPADILAGQIEAVITDIGADAVKIGMLHTPEIVDVVTNAISHYSLSKVVLDPVMASASGSALIEKPTIAKIINQLLPIVDIITPNLDEAAILLQRSIEDEKAMEKAALDLLTLGCKAVLLKGGHLAGSEVIDILIMKSPNEEITQYIFRTPRIDSNNLHGTGCTLASAIACYLGFGHDLRTAVDKACAYIRQAIEQGKNQQTGHGPGPLNHGFAPQGMHILPR